MGASILQSLDDWRYVLHDRKGCDIIYFDFVKAFVCHNIFELVMLKIYLSTCTENLISGRKYQVKVSKHYFKTEELKRCASRKPSKRFFSFKRSLSIAEFYSSTYTSVTLSRLNAFISMSHIFRSCRCLSCFVSLS